MEPRLLLAYTLIALLMAAAIGFGLYLYHHSEKRSELRRQSRVRAERKARATEKA